MGEEIKEPDPGYAQDSWGGETDWNLIRGVAGDVDGVDRDQAWLQLVERYRIPVRRMLRRLLRDDPSADDAANDFFSYLFQKQILPKADPGQGRFRCYIQGVMKRYAKQWRRATSMTRAEDVDGLEVGDEGETEFEREEELLWAEAVLDHAIGRLAREAPKDAELIVRFYGLGGGGPVSGDALAREKGVKDNALHVALHRARGRLQAALLEELRPMVSTRDELVQERELLVSRLLTAHPGIF